jgi:hypothetical protein
MAALPGAKLAATLPEPSAGSTDADGDWAEFEKLE